MTMNKTTAMLGFSCALIASIAAIPLSHMLQEIPVPKHVFP